MTKKRDIERLREIDKMPHQIALVKRYVWMVLEKADQQLTDSISLGKSIGKKNAKHCGSSVSSTLFHFHLF